MTPQMIMQWVAFAQQAASLGVRSWQVIRGAMSDAGVADDDAAIAALQVKWDALVDDIKRAAGE